MLSHRSWHSDVYNILRLQGYSSPVISDTEDTDNYVQAAHIAHRIPEDLYIKGKQQFINASTLCDQEMASSIIQLHVLSGCDHNSRLCGVSKKATVDRIEKSSNGHKLLQGCGNSLPAGDETINDITKFVIRYVFSDVKSNNLPDARAIKWRDQNKKNMSRLPPAMHTLRAHIERANYLAYIQTHYEMKQHPSPLGYGWHISDQLCLPVRNPDSPLPDAISLACMAAEISDCTSESEGQSDTDTSDSEI